MDLGSKQIFCGFYWAMSRDLRKNSLSLGRTDRFSFREQGAKTRLVEPRIYMHAPLGQENKNIVYFLFNVPVKSFQCHVETEPPLTFRVLIIDVL